MLLISISYANAGDVIVENGKIDVADQIKIGGGNPGQGKVLTSDATGLASWQTPSSGLPSGTSGQTLRNDGTNWVANSLLSNDGNNVVVQKNNEIYLSVKNTETNGKEYALVSAGSLGGIGLGKFSIYDKTADVSRLTIDTEGNVGIGTTGPTLTASSDRGMQIGGGETNTEAVIRLTARGAGAGTGRSWGLITRNTPNFQIYDFNEGGTAATRLLIDSTGNVGIGAAIPTTKLHVKNTADNSVIVADSGDGVTQRFSSVDFYDNNVPKWGIGKNTVGDFYIDQSGTSGGRAISILSSNRNVGIGVAANPQASLHVGKSAISGENLLGIFQSYQSTGGATLRLKTSLLTSGATGSAEISGLRTNAVTDGDTDLIFRTSAGSTLTPRMRIVGSSGSVGIGTETPDTNSKLEVAGQIKITGGTPAAGKILTSDASGLATWQTAPTGLPSGTSGQTLRNDGTNWVANSLLFNDGNNVVVQKNNEIYLSVKNTETNGKEYALVSAGSAGGIGAGKFSIYDKIADNSRLTIDTNGNVGVGTPGPGARLDVQIPITDASTNLLTISKGTSNYMTISNNGDVNLGGTLQSGNVPWARLTSFPAACPAGQYVTTIAGVLTCSTPSFIETDPTVRSWAKTDTPTIPGDTTINGNVGLGTAPDLVAKLKVAGPITITDGTQGANKVLTSDATGLASWQNPSGGSGSLPSGTSGQTLRHDGTNWVANSILFNDGNNVGIGTAATGNKLEVNGVVNAACPSGMTDAGRYCIETSERATATWDNAVDVCGDAGRQLCSPQEWYYACLNFGSLSGMVNNYEWTDNRYSTSWAYVRGSGSCTADSINSETTLTAYRCCVDKKLSST